MFGKLKHICSVNKIYKKETQGRKCTNTSHCIAMAFIVMLDLYPRTLISVWWNGWTLSEESPVLWLSGATFLLIYRSALFTADHKSLYKLGCWYELSGQILHTAWSKSYPIISDQETYKMADVSFKKNENCLRNSLVHLLIR